MRRLEAICDGLAFGNCYAEPESRAYELRNPGLLADPTNGHTKRYSSHWAGYRSLFECVSRYCNQHHSETLGSMLVHFNIEKFRQKDTIGYISRCVNSQLKMETQLNWFIEGENGHSANHSI